jgi:hypothetical protein
MKQRILNDICLKLSELEIPYKIKEDSYIYVSEEFYDIGLGTDLKKVQYDLTVFVDDDKKSVHLYVSTIDESLLPNTAPAETCGQPVSMFRKVKRVSYDKDGQSTVETVDLGAVPNTVKNTAFKYGWKFSTALNLNKPVRKQEPPKPEPLPADLTLEEETVKLSEPEQAGRQEKKKNSAVKSALLKLLGKKGYQPRH